jgi:hypothetical protein
MEARDDVGDGPEFRYHPRTVFPRELALAAEGARRQERLPLATALIAAEARRVVRHGFLKKLVPRIAE